MTKDKKIEEKYTPDNFIDKVFEDNTNASYDETIQAMAKAIDEIKYDEDTIEDDLISEAASRIASAYGTDVASAYDDLINAQDEKYANHSYPSADDLEGTYGGPLDEDNQKSNTSLLADLEINLFDINTSKSKDPEENYSISVNEGSFGHSLEANFLEAKEFASEYGLRVYALKDYDISDEDKLELAHVIYAGKAKNILKYLHDNFNAGEDVKWAKENKIDYKPVDETLEKTDNKFNDFGKTWSVFKIHMHGSEPEQEVAKGLSSREAADKVTSLRAVEKDKDISYVSHSVEHSKFIKDHQKFVNNKDSEDDLQEDYHDRQKSIRCLKGLGKNYNFDRFSDQQLYVMCKKAQREAQQLAQEQTEMEDELENCPEAQTCPQCGGPLNDAGECPKCDLGDEDESLKEDERKINSQSEKETSFEDINVGDGFDEISFWDENSVLGHVGDDAVMRAVLHLAKKYYIYNHDKIKGYGADDALVNAYEHIDNNGVWFDLTVEEDNQLKDALKDWIDYPGTPAPDFKDEEAEFSKSLDAACKQHKLFDFISNKVDDKDIAKEICLAFLGVIDDDQHLSDTSTREHLANVMEDNMNDQGAIDACNSYTLFDYIAENYYDMSLEDLKELAETFLDAIDDWMTLNSEYTMQTIRDEFVNRDLIIESSR